MPWPSPPGRLPSCRALRAPSSGPVPLSGRSLALVSAPRRRNRRGSRSAGSRLHRGLSGQPHQRRTLPDLPGSRARIEGVSSCRRRRTRRSRGGATRCGDGLRPRGAEQIRASREERGRAARCIHRRHRNRHSCPDIGFASVCNRLGGYAAPRPSRYRRILQRSMRGGSRCGHVLAPSCRHSRRPGERRYERSGAAAAQRHVGLGGWRHRRLTIATASWLTQSTGNMTMSARLTRPASRPLRSSTPPSWCRNFAPSLLAQRPQVAQPVGAAADIEQRQAGQGGGRRRFEPRRLRGKTLPQRPPALRAGPPRLPTHGGVRSRRGQDRRPRASRSSTATRRLHSDRRRLLEACDQASRAARPRHRRWPARRLPRRCGGPAGRSIPGSWFAPRDAVAQLVLLAAELGAQPVVLRLEVGQAADVGAVGRSHQVGKHVDFAEDLAHQRVAGGRMGHRRPVGAGDVAALDGLAPLGAHLVDRGRALSKRADRAVLAVQGLVQELGRPSRWLGERDAAAGEDRARSSVGRAPVLRPGPGAARRSTGRCRRSSNEDDATAPRSSCGATGHRSPRPTAARSCAAAAATGACRAGRRRP